MRRQFSTLLQPYVPATGIMPPTIANHDSHYTPAYTSYMNSSMESTRASDEPMVQPSSLYGTGAVSLGDAYEGLRWANMSPRSQTSPPNSPHTTSNENASWSIEPPRHSQTLYSSIPLPVEGCSPHPVLRYDLQPKLRLSSILSCYDQPATIPGVEILTVILPWANMTQITVEPLQLQATTPRNPYANFVTVGDVLDAIDKVLDTIDTRCSACPSRTPASGSNRNPITGRKCVCVGEVGSIVYLRRRYGRAGLNNVDTRGKICALSIG